MLIALLVVIIGVLFWFLLDKPGYNTIISYFSKAKGSIENMPSDDWDLHASIKKIIPNRENREIKYREQISFLQNELRNERDNYSQLSQECQKRMNELTEQNSSKDIQIKELSSSLNIIQEELRRIQYVLDSLYPVSKEDIAKPYLSYIEKINAVLNDALDSFILVLEGINYQDSGHFIKFLRFQLENLDETTMLLASISCVKSEVAVDLKNKNYDTAKLDYLEKRVLRYHYRPILNRIFIVLESFRNSTSNDKQIGTIIQILKERLSDLGIYVLYYQIGQELTTNDFKYVQVDTPSSTNVIDFKQNQIINIKHYAVNFSILGDDIEKTVIEAII